MLNVTIIAGIIHNVIFSKIVIRGFLKYFRVRYQKNNEYWEYFQIEKDFHLKIVRNFDAFREKK